MSLLLEGVLIGLSEPFEDTETQVADQSKRTRS